MACAFVLDSGPFLHALHRLQRCAHFSAGVVAAFVLQRALRNRAAPCIRDLRCAWRSRLDKLRSRFPNIEFVEYPVFGNIHGADENEIVRQLPERLKELGCDAVVVGVGH